MKALIKSQKGRDNCRRAFLFIRMLRRLKIVDFDEAQEMRCLIYRFNKENW